MTPFRKATIADLGITKRQSSLWQKLAAMSDAAFEAWVKHASKKKSKRKSKPKEEEPEGPKDRHSLWLWGRLLEFERDGVLDRKPADVLVGMTDVMGEKAESYFFGFCAACLSRMAWARASIFAASASRFVFRSTAA